MKMQKLIIIGLLIVVLAGCGKEYTPEQRVVQLRLAMDKEDYETALEHFNVIKIERPTDEMGLYLGARLLEQIGQMDSALAYAKKYSALYPKDIESQKYLFNLCEQLRDYETQMQVANILASLENNRPKYLPTIADLNMKIGMPGMTVSICNGILEKDPGNDQIRFLLASGYSACGKLDSAIIAMEYLNARHPEELEIMNNLATYYSQASMFDKAAELYRKITQLYPTYIPAFYGLGNVLLVKGDTAGAVEAYRVVQNVDSLFLNVDSIMNEIEKNQFIPPSN